MSQSLVHSAKYKQLIHDIRKHKIVQGTGRCFSIGGYVRNGVWLKDCPCQILFHKVGPSEPHGILYSKDHSRVDIIHDFEDIDNIFNEHRINADGCGCVRFKEFLCEHENYSTPVFVSYWAVFEQYVTNGKGLFVHEWHVPST